MDRSKFGECNPPNYAFIDSQNLHLGVKSQGWELDFVKFRVYLKDKLNVEEAYLFIGYVSGNEGLYTHLQRAGYTIIFKPTLEYKDNTGKRKIKGNVDAELVLHVMIEYNNYKQAVIVSGDGDSRCLVEHLAENDKLTRLVIPNQKSYSSLLLPFKEYMLFLTEDHKEKLGK